MTEELLDRYLPKWPQMLVWGKPVTEEQAIEIIRRTDSFFLYGGGNDHSYNRRIRSILGLPKSYLDLTDEEIKQEPINKSWEQEVSWLKTWGHIETEYVHNAWISCAYIGGPHGWCHPNGTIRYTNNVGKWPSCEDVYKDWKKLSEAFSFLDLKVILMSGEETESNKEPVIGFHVHDGIVDVFDPEKDKCDIPFYTESAEGLAFKFAGRFGSPNFEHGLTDEIIFRFRDKALELGLVK